MIKFFFLILPGNPDRPTGISSLLKTFFSFENNTFQAFYPPLGKTIQVDNCLFDNLLQKPEFKIWLNSHHETGIS